MPLVGADEEVVTEGDTAGAVAADIAHGVVMLQRAGDRGEGRAGTLRTLGPAAQVDEVPMPVRSVRATRECRTVTPSMT